MIPFLLSLSHDHVASLLSMRLSHYRRHPKQSTRILCVRARFNPKGELIGLINLRRDADGSCYQFPGTSPVVERGIIEFNALLQIFPSASHRRQAQLYTVPMGRTSLSDVPRYTDPFALRVPRMHCPAKNKQGQPFQSGIGHVVIDVERGGVVDYTVDTVMKEPVVPQTNIIKDMGSMIRLSCGFMDQACLFTRVLHSDKTRASTINEPETEAA